MNKGILLTWQIVSLFSLTSRGWLFWTSRSSTLSNSRRMTSCRYTIPAAELATPSPRPHHVNERIVILDSFNLFHDHKAADARRKGVDIIANRAARKHCQVEEARARLEAAEAAKQAHWEHVVRLKEEALAFSAAQRARRHQFAVAHNAKVRAVASRVSDLSEQQKAVFAQNLEADLASAAIRRQERLQRRVDKVTARSSMRQPVPYTGLFANADLAATAIQVYWRFHRTRNAVAACRATKLASKHVDLVDATFDEVTGLMQDKRVMVAVRGLLSLVDQKHALQTRIFLSAYLLRYFPSATLSRPSEEQAAMLSIGTNMLDSLERLIHMNVHNKITMLVYHSHLLKFQELWIAFRTSFDAWKKADADEIVKGLVAHYNELNALKESLFKRGDHHEIDDFLPSIITQQIAIRTRLAKFNATDAIDQLPADELDETLRKRRRQPTETEDAPSTPHTPPQPQVCVDDLYRQNRTTVSGVLTPPSVNAGPFDVMVSSKRMPHLLMA